MIGNMPKFYDSPYFVDEPGNWHLKPNAPEEVRKEFEAYMKGPNRDPEKAVGAHNDAVTAFQERRAHRMRDKK